MSHRRSGQFPSAREINFGVQSKSQADGYEALATHAFGEVGLPASVANRADEFLNLFWRRACKVFDFINKTKIGSRQLFLLGHQLSVQIKIRTVLLGIFIPGILSYQSPVTWLLGGDATGKKQGQQRESSFHHHPSY